MIYIGELIANH